MFATEALVISVSLRICAVRVLPEFTYKQICWCVRVVCQTANTVRISLLFYMRQSLRRRFVVSLVLECGLQDF